MTTREQRQIWTIIGKKGYAERARPSLERTQQRERVASARRFRPELQRGGSSREHGLGEREGLDPALVQEVEVDDGVQAFHRREFTRRARSNRPLECGSSGLMFQRVAFFARRLPRSCALGRLCSGRSLVAVALALLPAGAAAVHATDAVAAAEPATAPMMAQAPASSVAPDTSGTAASPTTADAPAAGAPAAAAAVNASPALDPEGALIALGRDLELIVTETGPEQPWTLHLRNRGTTPIGLMADPGLLWFEVSVPGASSAHVCRLPEPLWPKGMRRRAEVTLGAGERFSRRFDPRFFCFHDLVQTTLVPNARVIPHFGWPVETRSTTVKGKRIDQPLPARAPFVAWALPRPSLPSEPAPAPNPDEEDTTDEARIAPEAPWEPPTEGLKNVVGSAIVLGSTYGKWSERVPSPTDGLQLAMLAGSDAEDERAATVTVGVGNAGEETQTLVVRRELIAFAVRGPDGSFECPTGDMGPPDIASFSTLGQRASEQFVVRLIEMCPRGGFGRPGLYEVSATWHARFSGQALGIDAFVGTVSSSRPALVRVRSGERASFLRAAPMVATGEGGGTQPGQGPAGNGAEPAPLDDAAGDHEGAPMEEAPQPADPAPDGTSVE